MKTIVFAVLGAVLGAVVGAFGMYQHFTPALLEAQTTIREQNHQLQALASNEDSGARLARLEAERADYEKTLDDLRKQLEAARTRPVAQSETPVAIEDDLEAEAMAEQDRERPERDGDRDRRDRGGPPWDRDSTPEEREARRQEFRARMEENLAAFFTGELEKSSTPAMRERLVALETQAYDLMELRRQMRDVETDEERDALRAAFGDTMAAAQATMRDQQRDMIDAIARQFDITNDADKTAFQNAVRAAVDNPVFSDNPFALFMSAGRPDGFGGPGGPGRGPGRGFGR